MGFNSVYQTLKDLFPQVDARSLKAVATEHAMNSDTAVETILTEVLPLTSEKSIIATPTDRNNGKMAESQSSSILESVEGKDNDSCMNDAQNIDGDFLASSFYDADDTDDLQNGSTKNEDLMSLTRCEETIDECSNDDCIQPSEVNLGDIVIGEPVIPSHDYQGKRTAVHVKTNKASSSTINSGSSEVNFSLSNHWDAFQERNALDRDFWESRIPADQPSISVTEPEAEHGMFVTDMYKEFSTYVDADFTKECKLNTKQKSTCQSQLSPPKTKTRPKFFEIMVKFRVLNHGLSLILCFLVLQSSVFWGVDARRSQLTQEAYVTLLYGDEFVLGVRVLGKSIRDTGSKKDMVVLVSDGVSDYAKSLLEADGWIVELISLLENPNRVRPTRFWGVYTKLKIFNMTNYKKVVYLDADTIVIKSIDDLFSCGKFCANLKHSERLNSGVLVVQPSKTLFSDMLKKVSTLPSYTGGDQGFLNSYYAGFADAHLFDPNLSPEELKSRPVPEMERISTLYNADVGLYMLANKWMVDEKELRVIHYTLGPLKPWDWWTAWLVKPVDLWQDIRQRVEESLPGTGGGRNPQDEFLVKALFLLPFIGLIFLYYRSLLQALGSLFRTNLCDRMRHLAIRLRTGGVLTFAAGSASSAMNSKQQLYSGFLFRVPWFLGGMSIFVCLLAVVNSLGLALLIVPRQVLPWTGLVLMYEWTFTIFYLLFGGYLRLVYQWGKRNAVQAGSYSSDPESIDYDYGKGHQRQVSSYDAAVLYYGLGMVVLAIAVPSLPFLLGITALFVRLGLMVVGGIVLAAFMAYASEHLAIQSFLRGLEDREMSWTRQTCW